LDIFLPKKESGLSPFHAVVDITVQRAERAQPRQEFLFGGMIIGPANHKPIQTQLDQLDWERPENTESFRERRCSYEIRKLIYDAFPSHIA